MNTKPRKTSSYSQISGAALLLLLPFYTAQAAQTSYISPNAVGTYTQWTGGADFNAVSDGIGCVVSDATGWLGIAGRNTAAIPLGASGIPDGSTITSVDVQVCQGYIFVGGAQFQTVIRLNGGDIGSGVGVAAAAAATATTQTISIAGGLLYSSASTLLEAGGLVTVAGANQNVIFQTVAARINYAPPTTTTVTCEMPATIGSASACTATVTPGQGGPPTASVTWATDNSGSFSSQSCAPNGTDQVCTADYTPGVIGTHVVTATYPNDLPNFTGSAGVFTLQAAEPEPVPALGPLGLLLTMLGAGLIGGWNTRRRS